MKLKGFTQLSNEFLRDPNLSPGAKVILQIIASHDQNTYTINRSVLLYQAGLSSKAGRKCIEELTSKNYLIIERYRNAKTWSYKYIIVNSITVNTTLDKKNKVKKAENIQTNSLAYELLNEITGFDSATDLEKTLEVLTDLKMNGVSTTPLSNRTYDIDVLINLIKQ